MESEEQFQFDFANPVSPMEPVQSNTLVNERQLLGMEKPPEPDPFIDSLEPLGEGLV